MQNESLREATTPTGTRYGLDSGAGMHTDISNGWDAVAERFIDLRSSVGASTVRVVPGIAA